MINNNSILFGQKDHFAIEIKSGKGKKYKFRFWIKSTPIGSFTKSGELKYSIKAYKDFVGNKDSYYLPIFDHLTINRIYVYLTDVTLLLNGDSEGMAEFEKREKFYRFFGDQISNNTTIILLYKSPNVIFLVSESGSEMAKGFEVVYDGFVKVFKQFVSYCETNEII